MHYRQFPMCSLDEVTIEPAPITTINSRKEVNPFTEDNKLPVFIAPMTCITSFKNIECFNNSKFNPILPVTHNSFTERLNYSTKQWTAFTLDEAEHLSKKGGITVKYLLIDTANGHMKRIYDVVKVLKLHNPDIKIMVGNIASAYTYEYCVEADVDYVRVGIGGGSGCTTSVQTGIHTSLPTLLSEIKEFQSELRRKYPNKQMPKIIADGGVNTIAKAMKCLALGADYVMLGKLIAQCKESYSKDYYGQSSLQGQMDRFGTIKSNPEGTVIKITKLYNLKEFEDLFEASLRSMMSYINAKNLSDIFKKGYVSRQTINEFNSYNK